MLEINVPSTRYWDAKREQFFYYPEKPVTLQLEHSLVSISKWESKWNKPFLHKFNERTEEEVRDYIRCMTLTKNVDPYLFSFLPANIVKEITDYINAPMTATTFSQKDRPSREIVTSEFVYFLDG